MAIVTKKNVITQIFQRPYNLISILAAGGADDWARGDMGIKWVFLIELPDTGTFGFLLPANKIVPTGQSIFEGIRALAVTISHTLVY